MEEDERNAHCRLRRYPASGEQRIRILRARPRGSIREKPIERGVHSAGYGRGMSLDEYLALNRLPRIGFETETEADTAPAKRWETKLGGAPYLPAGASWPRRVHVDEDGEPLEGHDDPLGFVAQLNLGDIEEWRVSVAAPQVLEGLLPTAGILQFFVPIDEHGGLEDDDPWVATPALYWPDVVEDERQLEPAVLAFQHEDDPDIRFVEETAQLEFNDEYPGDPLWCGVNYVPLHQPQFPVPLRPVRLKPETTLPDFDNVDFPDSLEAWRNQLSIDEFIRIENVAIGHETIQLGGHPKFVDDDPREHEDCLLLFQLSDAVSDAVGMGEGTMHFCIDRSDLETQSFERVRMTWGF